MRLLVGLFTGLTSPHPRGRVTPRHPDRVAIPLANSKLIQGNIINNHIRYKTTEGTTLLIDEKGIITEPHNFYGIANCITPLATVGLSTYWSGDDYSMWVSKSNSAARVCALVQSDTGGCWASWLSHCRRCTEYTCWSWVEFGWSARPMEPENTVM